MKDKQGLPILGPLKIYVVERNIPRDGYGPVVILARRKSEAKKIFLTRFIEKYPGICIDIALEAWGNSTVKTRPVRSGTVVLDHHGI